MQNGVAESAHGLTINRYAFEVVAGEMDDSGNAQNEHFVLDTSE